MDHLSELNLNTIYDTEIKLEIVYNFDGKTIS